ncbi:MAG TPA: hypothetical protein VGK23_02865 [Methanomassiliicoccales archaeon]
MRTLEYPPELVESANIRSLLPSPVTSASWISEAAPEAVFK